MSGCFVLLTHGIYIILMKTYFISTEEYLNIITPYLTEPMNLIMEIAKFRYENLEKKIS